MQMDQIPQHQQGAEAQQSWERIPEEWYEILQTSRSLLMNKIWKIAHQAKIAIMLKMLAAIWLLAIMEST